MKTCLLIPIGLAACLAVAGCATERPAPPAATVSPAAAKAPPPVVHDELLIPANRVNAIAKGMKAEKVRELLGAPQSVTPYPPGGANSEIWTYRVSVTETVQQVPTSFIDVPGWDPISNTPTTTKQPVYSLQHLRTYQTLELLMLDGRLMERKAGRDSDRAYY